MAKEHSSVQNLGLPEVARVLGTSEMRLIISLSAVEAGSASC